MKRVLAGVLALVMLLCCMPEMAHAAGTDDQVKRYTVLVLDTSSPSDGELFTRLLYYGIAHLHLTQDEVWLMPFGLLLDLWECHKQFNGISKPKHELSIDDVIPTGI